MSRVITAWIEANEEEHGHYAALAGFEAAIKAHDDALGDAYGALNIFEQVQLFGFVVKLLEEERGAQP